MSTAKKKSWGYKERELALCCAITTPATSVKLKLADHIDNKVENLNSEIQRFKKIIKGDRSDTGKTGKVRLEIVDEFYKDGNIAQDKAKRLLESCVGSIDDVSKDFFQKMACCCSIVSPLVAVKEVLAHICKKPFSSFDSEVAKFSKLLKLELEKQVELGKSDQARLKVINKIKGLSHKAPADILLNELKKVDASKDWGISEVLGGPKLLKADGYNMAVSRYDSICSRTFDRLLSDSFFYHYFMNTDESRKREFKFIDIAQVDLKDQKLEMEKAITYNMALITSHQFDFQKLPQVDAIEMGIAVTSATKDFFSNMKNVQMKNTLYERWKSDNRSIIKSTKKEFKLEFQKVLSLEDFSKKIFGRDHEERTCCYCDLTESESKILKDNDLLFTKKLYCKGKTMEIDQKDAYMGYTFDNIVLACYWCNNAKTDEYSFDEWMSVGKVFRKIWDKRKESIK